MMLSPAGKRCLHLHPIPVFSPLPFSSAKGFNDATTKWNTLEGRQSGGINFSPNPKDVCMRKREEAGNLVAGNHSILLHR